VQTPGSVTTAPVSEPDWRIAGSIQAILTMNLSGRAFRELDDPERESYWFRRAGGSFAAWLRKLGNPTGQRIVHTGSPFLHDDEGARLESLGYGAGLLSQYVVDQELMPTYLVPEGCPCPTLSFGRNSEELFDAVRQVTSRAAASQLKARLEKEANARLARVWKDWRSKRVRLSRYGAVQVVLELGMAGATTPQAFVEPITSLGAPLGPKGMAELVCFAADEPDRAELERLRTTFLDLPAVKSRRIETSIQWEIVGRVLGWLIDCIDRTNDGGDELQLDPTYAERWRDRQTFTGGQDLPFRRRFLILRIDRLEIGGAPTPALDPRMKRELAQLLDETPLVQGNLRDVTSRLSLQRPDLLRRAAREDHATWEQEACLLAHDAAVLVNLHDGELLLKLDRDVTYRDYWRIVGRTMEYLSELRLVARFLENVCSASLEGMMGEIMRNRRMTVSYQEKLSGFVAAEAVMLLRLQNASSPTAISSTDAVVAKLAALREHFGIPAALRHIGTNLAAAQRLVGHYEGLSAQRKMVDLHVGIAGFTGVLMGLTLPTFVRDVFFEEPLAHQSLALWAGLVWAVVTVLAIGRAIHEVTVHGHESSYRLLRWLGKKLGPGPPVS